MSYALGSKNNDGTISEVELTAAQALDPGAGKAIAYTPRDERVLVDDEGQIIRRESAIPQQRDPRWLMAECAIESGTTPHCSRRPTASPTRRRRSHRSDIKPPRST